MARINKQEVLQEMQEGLRLDTLRDKTPDQLAEKVLPIYQVNPRPRIIKIEDAILNDSDKRITVPVGKKWKILYGNLTLTTSATVGNRRVEFNIRDDADNVLYILRAVNVQTANTGEQYLLGQFGNYAEDLTEFHLLPIPVNSFLIENYDIRVRDVSATDAAADDLTIRIMVEESDMNPNR